MRLATILALLGALLMLMPATASTKDQKTLRAPGNAAVKKGAAANPAALPAKRPLQLDDLCKNGKFADAPKDKVGALPAVVQKRLGTEIKCEPKGKKEAGWKFAEQDGGPAAYPMSWRAFCLQVNVPGEAFGVPLTVFNFGLNNEQRTGADCKNWKKEGDKCYMQNTIQASVGVSFVVGALGSGSVYLTLELDLSTDSGTPCAKIADESVEMAKPNDADKGNSQKCGVWRLWSAFIANYFGTGNMFTDPKFKAAMFRSTVIEAAQVEAEKETMEDRIAMNELLSSVADTAAIEFPPQSHPFYRMGRTLFASFYGYWYDHVVTNADDAAKGWFAHDSLPLARVLLNRKEVKAALKVPGTTVPAKKYAYISEHLGYSTAGVSRSDYINFKNSLADKVKTVDDVKHVFVWMVKYILETSIIKLLFSNPSADEGRGSYEQFQEADKDPTLSVCSSFPAYYDGEIHQNKNTLQNYVKAQTGDKVPKPTAFTFRASPRLTCVLGKEISSITDADYGSKRPRFKRKQCTTDDAKCKTKDMDPIACGICVVPKTKKAQCDRLISTNKDCKDADAGYKYSDFKLDADNKAKYTNLQYQIPLWSANVFPYVAKEAVATMTKLRKEKDVKKAKGLVTAFKDFIKDDTKSKIKDSFKIPFEVLDATGSAKVCPDFIPGDKAKCNPAEYAKMFPGKVYGLTKKYMEKLDQWGKETQDKFKAYVAKLKYKEKIDYSFTGMVGITAGGSSVDDLGKALEVGASGVGFCTPDTNKFQLIVPAVSVSGTIDPASGCTSKWPSGGVDFSASLHLHLIEMIQFGGSISYNTATKQATLGFDFKLYLPASSAEVGDASASSLSAKLIQFIPMIGYMIRFISDFSQRKQAACPDSQDSCWGTIILKECKMLGQELKANAKDFFEFAVGAAATGFVALLAAKAGESLIKMLSGSSMKTYVFIDVHVDLPLKLPLTFPEIGIIASWCNIAELSIFGVIKPMAGIGSMIDVGHVLNVIIQGVFSGIDFLKGGAKGSKAVFKDFRTDRCKECVSQCETMTGGKAVVCDTKASEVEKARCRYIKGDIKEYLKSNRYTNGLNIKWPLISSSGGEMARDAFKGTFITSDVAKVKFDFKGYVDKQCPDGLTPAWCKHEVQCRIMGASCFKQNAEPAKLMFLETAGSGKSMRGSVSTDEQVEVEKEQDRKDLMHDDHYWKLHPFGH